MKVFISGPMTGYPEHNRPAFFKVAEKILSNGDIPLNPAIFPDGLTYNEYMTLCEGMLKIADKVVMLPGWKGSKGALTEHRFAALARMDIEYL